MTQSPLEDVPSAPLVGLFHTCLVDLYRPNVGFAAVSLLERAGCRVEVPAGQTCCGQPAFNSGDDADARALARRVIDEFERYDFVVGPSGSCMGMIRTHYPGLFAEDPGWRRRAESLAARSYELLSFLTDVMRFDGVQTDYAGTATYHDSCAGLREMGVKQQPRQLLAQVQGLSLNEMQEAETCCGFGGTFCIKFPEISSRLVSDKIVNIEASGADTVLGGDMGCLLNIAGRLRRLDKPVKVYHVAEVLAGMTDVPPIGRGEER